MAINQIKNRIIQLGSLTRGYFTNVLSGLAIFSQVIMSVKHLTSKNHRTVFYRFLFSRIASIISQTAFLVIILSLLISLIAGLGLSGSFENISNDNLIPLYGIGNGLIFNVVAYELSPLLIGMIFITASGGPITAEIAQRKLGNEFATCRSMGVDPILLFLLPVLISYPLVMVISVIYFDLIGLVSYHFFLGNFGLMLESDYTQYLSQVLSTKGFLVSIVKMVFGGLIIAIIAINHGTRVIGRNSGVPVVISDSTISQLLTFFVVSAVISTLGLLIK